MALPQLVTSNPVFADYAFYATVMGVKTLYLGIKTTTKRVSLGKYATKEDVAFFYSGKDTPEQRMEPDDSVERVRMNHLNDLENIPVFWILGLFYVLIDPDPEVARWHFRVFAFSRLAHTFVYQWAIPQPARSIAHVVGLTANLSMAFQILKFFW